MSFILDIGLTKGKGDSQPLNQWVRICGLKSVHMRHTNLAIVYSLRKDITINGYM